MLTPIDQQNNETSPIRIEQFNRKYKVNIIIAKAILMSAINLFSTTINKWYENQLNWLDCVYNTEELLMID